MEFGLLAMFILFTVAMFDQYKDRRWFFFLVVGVGSIYGVLEYILPMYISQQVIAFSEKGITTALMVSGFYGIFKKKMENVQK